MLGSRLGSQDPQRRSLTKNKESDQKHTHTQKNDKHTNTLPQVYASTRTHAPKVRLKNEQALLLVDTPGMWFLAGSWKGASCSSAHLAAEIHPGSQGEQVEGQAMLRQVLDKHVALNSRRIIVFVCYCLQVTDKVLNIIWKILTHYECHHVAVAVAVYHKRCWAPPAGGDGFSLCRAKVFAALPKHLKDRLSTLVRLGSICCRSF